MKRDHAVDGKPVLRLETGLEIRLGNLWTGIGLVLCAVLIGILAVSVGNTDTGIGDLLRSLAGGTLTADQTYALWSVRLPRILTGFMAGWSVALAGAMLQSIARNPLADPGLFGLSQGSVLAVILLLVIAPAMPKTMIAVAALGGGFAVATLLIALVGGARSGGLAILLMGIAIESVLSSFSAFLLLYTPAEISHALTEWMAGSLFQANWGGVVWYAPLTAFSLIGIFLIGRTLAAYDLGNEVAMAIGEPVGLSRPLMLFFAVLLSSAAVSAVGPLTFLGVLAPQLVSFLSPSIARARLLLSAITGGLLVVAADTLTRGLAADVPLPIGLSLTVIGVPLFIVALRLHALRRFNAH